MHYDICIKRASNVFQCLARAGILQFGTAFPKSMQLPREIGIAYYLRFPFEIEVVMHFDVFFIVFNCVVF